MHSSTAIMNNRDTSLHPYCPNNTFNHNQLMKKNHSTLYIDKDGIVNEEDIREAERIENDPKKILALIDLIFMFEEQKKVIPS